MEVIILCRNSLSFNQMLVAIGIEYMERGDCSLGELLSNFNSDYSRSDGYLVDVGALEKIKNIIRFTDIKSAKDLYSISKVLLANNCRVLVKEGVSLDDVYSVAINFFGEVYMYYKIDDNPKYLIDFNSKYVKRAV